MFRFGVRCALLCFLILRAIDSIGQTSATISVDKTVVNAGEPIKGTVTFDAPAPCDADVWMVLQTKTQNPPLEIDLHNRIPKGQQTVAVQDSTAPDSPGGELDSIKVLFRCPGYQNSHTINTSSTVHVTVLPVPDPYAYPTRVDVSLDVSQKQFLATKAHELDTLLVNFANGIELHPATTEDQKDFLVSVIEDARSTLDETEKQYQQKILKPNEQLPIFFEDFREHYTDLEIEIKARRISDNKPVPHLVPAQTSNPQLRKRQNKKQPTPTPPSTTLTPDAMSTAHLIEDNKKAYTYVEDHGVATFTTSLLTIPDGARVSYRRTTQKDFIDYPTPTNVTAATFPLAYLEFRFHKDNCGEDQHLRIDPWDDPSAPIKMELTKCR